MLLCCIFFFFPQSLTPSWSPAISQNRPWPPSHLEFGPPGLPPHETLEQSTPPPNVAAAQGPARVSGEQPWHRTISEKDIWCETWHKRTGSTSAELVLQPHNARCRPIVHTMKPRGGEVIHRTAPSSTSKHTHYCTMSTAHLHSGVLHSKACTKCP